MPVGHAVSATILIPTSSSGGCGPPSHVRLPQIDQNSGDKGAGHDGEHIDEAMVYDRQHDRPAMRSMIPHATQHGNDRGNHGTSHNARDYPQRVGGGEGDGPL